MKRFLKALTLFGMLCTLVLGWSAARAAGSQDYVLGPGDVIRVTVFQNNDLTAETRVSESGVISYPLLGTIKLGGLTVSAAEKAIADGLRNGHFVKQPQVSIFVIKIQGNQVSVLGQVNRPGRYPLESAGTKLSDVMALAGGVNVAGSDFVVLTGVRDGKPMRQTVDLPGTFAPGQRSVDPVLQDGDTIWVERYPLIYVYGEVQRPGPYRLDRDMSVMQGLATAGGLTLRGTEKGLRIYRRVDGGPAQVLQSGLNEPLQSGDVLFIKESLF